jgi:hypothetical protein
MPQSVTLLWHPTAMAGSAEVRLHVRSGRMITTKLTRGISSSSWRGERAARARLGHTDRAAPIADLADRVSPESPLAARSPLGSSTRLALSPLVVRPVHRAAPRGSRLREPPDPPGSCTLTHSPSTQGIV